MTKYGRSPWIDQFPKSRVPAFPRQRGAMKTDVVIVGGGLTGCTTAYAFAAAGAKAVLVEGEQLGRGQARQKRVVASLVVDLRKFVSDHYPHGLLTADATEPAGLDRVVMASSHHAF